MYALVSSVFLYIVFCLDIQYVYITCNTDTNMICLIVCIYCMSHPTRKYNYISSTRHMSKLCPVHPCSSGPSGSRASEFLRLFFENTSITFGTLPWKMTFGNPWEKSFSNPGPLEAAGGAEHWVL